MDAAEDARQQAIARHRKPNARLPQLKNQQRGNHPQQRADQYDQAHVFQVQSFQRIHDGRGVIEQRLPGHESREHHHHGDVENRADHQRGDDSDGEIALRILASPRPRSTPNRSRCR